MKIFISYRRSDSDYLAGMIAADLRAAFPAASVFHDQTSIAAGTDYRSSIQSGLAGSDTVVLLIGPSWEASGRLADPDDFVRLELEAARENGARVLPVIHGRETVPAPGDLPDDLVWTAYLQNIRFGGFSTVDDDLRTLREAVQRVVPGLLQTRDQIWASHEKRDWDNVLQLVETAWRDHGHEQSAVLAECCRIAAVTMTAKGDVESRSLWWARALSTAFLSGARNVMATSLLPFFFQLSGIGRHEEAREVLAEMRRLIDMDEGAQAPVNRATIMRIYNDKLAWSLMSTGDHVEALASYERAMAAAADGDPRGYWKALGGAALGRYQLGDVERAITDTTAMVKEAERQGWKQLETAGAANVALMRQGVTEGLDPYEVV